MRRFLGYTLGGMMAATASHAATIENYAVEAAARISLTSAVFDTGLDAAGALSITYMLDGFDDFPQSDGNATVFTDFSRDDGTGTFGVETSGTAGPPFGSSTGRIRGKLIQVFENMSTAPVTLAFDYEIGGSGAASGGIGDYSFDAFVELHTDNAKIFGAEVGTFDIPGVKTGMTSAVFAPGEKLYAYSYAEAFGTAFAFGTVPLPASLPLLGVGVAALFGLRRRLRIRSDA